MWGEGCSGNLPASGGSQGEVASSSKIPYTPPASQTTEEVARVEFLLKLLNKTPVPPSLRAATG